MKINNNGYVNFRADDIQDKTEIEDKKPETKEIQVNSADALSSQGRAFVNMSFKGNVSNPKTTKIKKLTDEEFEELKVKLIYL